MSRTEHQDYYQLPYGIEVIDIAREMDFDLGNVIKYVLRAGKKTEQGMSNLDKQIEDLTKAAYYINDEIEHLKKRRAEREADV